MATREPARLNDIPGNDENQLGNKGEIPRDPIHFHQRLAEIQKHCSVMIRLKYGKR